MSDPILWAVPAFFALIAVEWGAARLKGQEVYRLNDTLANLHLGAGQVLLASLLKVKLIALYALVFTFSAPLRASLSLEWWSGSAFDWLLGALLMDLAYYWLHRLSHELNFMWAAHAVHHQSEEYNLSVALRQSWLQFVYSGLFYLPLALIGVPALPFFILNATNTLYQFWIHTRLIDRVGPFEWVINTPSHHRVHHGVDEPYLDKNYAGVLIIWDKLFGTFEPEAQAPTYGVVKPLKSWSSVWANVEVWASMWSRARAAHPQSLSASLITFSRLCVSAPTDTLPSEAPGAPARLGRPPYAARGALATYAALQGALTLLMGLWVIACIPTSGALTLTCWALLLLLGGASLGSLSEGKVWAQRAEWLRLAALPLTAWLTPLTHRFGEGALPQALSAPLLWALLSVGGAALFVWRSRSPDMSAASAVSSDTVSSDTVSSDTVSSGQAR